ncbi:hypothetical protein VNO78_38732 [Psophocarpus tetragonolobus]|uniref:Uncharacterized protein n=1 Tax=Psophocarpus tetragonolobus TaxID=3891 RepID=A0AAN9RB69_PSOTE
MESTSISHLFEPGVPPLILALLGGEPVSRIAFFAFGHAHIQRPTGCWIKKGINNTSCRAIGIQWIQQARMDRHCQKLRRIPNQRRHSRLLAFPVYPGFLLYLFLALYIHRKDRKELERKAFEKEGVEVYFKLGGGWKSIYGTIMEASPLVRI